MSNSLRIGMLCALVGAVGCNDSMSPQAELNEARARWQERGPSSYLITMTRWCECTAEMTGPVIVNVQNGAVASRTYTANGVSVPPSLADAFPPVEGLFQMIDNAIQRRAQVLDVRYDPGLGHPVMVFINDNPSMPDGDIRTVVTSLVPR
jgi:hypothetical protein